MPSIYVFEQDATSSASYIIAIASDGSKYRIQFDKLQGGLIINKTNDTGATEVLSIFPNVSNQIRIK